MRKIVVRFVRNESGAAAIEYGFIAAFMAVASSPRCRSSPAASPRASQPSARL